MPTQSTDLTTPVGQARVLAFDYNLAGGTYFDDDAYQVFLDINNGDIRLAAAQAVDVLASNEAYVQKNIKMLEASTDGASTAKDLHGYAAELRRQVFEGSGDFVGLFDYAEEVVNVFSARERIVAQWLRQNG